MWTIPKGFCTNIIIKFVPILDPTPPLPRPVKNKHFQVDEFPSISIYAPYIICERSFRFN